SDGLICMLMGFGGDGDTVWSACRSLNPEVDDIARLKVHDPGCLLLRDCFRVLRGTSVFKGHRRFTFFSLEELPEIEAARRVGPFRFLPDGLPIRSREDGPGDLCLVEPFGDRAVAGLAQALDGSPEHCWSGYYAALALKAMGKEARSAIPALQRALA